MTSVVELEVPSSCRLPHRACVLPNGLKLIVVEDCAAETSAAAMTIKAGSNHDPVHLEGCAHALEHLLFLGTTIYPTEGAYSNYVAQNGGHTNAWTEASCTVFYFCVRSAALDGALQRFLPFFTCPLLSESGVEREVQAVHSEDEKNHSIDYWRLDEIMRTLQNADHPYSRYGNGNAHTLWTAPREKGISVRDTIADFFRQHYVANGACLCVHSPLSLEAVRALVLPHIEAMPRGTVPSNRFVSLEAQLKPEALRCWYNVQTVKAQQRVRAQFVVPSSKPLYASLPSAYAGFVLGHECEGSILAVLKGRGWAEALVAGQGREIDDVAESFYVEVALTNEGVVNVEAVLSIVFQGIALLREVGGVEPALRRENMRNHEADFFLADTPSAAAHVGHLSRSGAEYPLLERAWSAGTRIFEADDAASWRVVECLTPHNCIVVFQTHDFEKSGLPDKYRAAQLSPDAATSRYHGAKYSVVTIDPAVLDAWATVSTAAGSIAKELRLPKANPFLPEDFTVFPCDTDRQPKIIRGTFGDVIWRRDIGLHHCPKASGVVDLTSPASQQLPLHRFYNRVWVSLLTDALTEELYFASLATMQCGFSLSADGVTAVVSGPSDKLFAFMQLLLRSMVSFAATDAQKFDVHRRRVERHLRGLLADQPSSVGPLFSNTWLLRAGWTVPEVIEVCAEATLEGFAAFLGEFWCRVRYSALWFGNVAPSSDETNGNTRFVPEQLKDLLDSLLSGRASVVATAGDFSPHKIVLDLCHPMSAADGSPCHGWLWAMPSPNSGDGNSSVEISYQLGWRNPRTRALQDCLAAVVSSPFFDQLRTKEALGYIVAAFPRVVENVCFLSFRVQSADYDAARLFQRAACFIDGAMRELLAGLTQEVFEGVVLAQVSKRLDPPKSVIAEASRLFDARDHPYGFFAAQELEVAALRALRVEELREFFTQHFYEAPRPLATAVFAQRFAGVLAARTNEATGTFSFDVLDDDESDAKKKDGALPCAGSTGQARMRYALLRGDRSTFRVTRPEVIDDALAVPAKP